MHAIGDIVGGEVVGDHHAGEDTSGGGKLSGCCCEEEFVVHPQACDASEVEGRTAVGEVDGGEGQGVTAGAAHVDRAHDAVDSEGSGRFGGVIANKAKGTCVHGDRAGVK